MTKVKNIEGFPGKITKVLDDSKIKSATYPNGYNQARKEIGELDITLDMGKIEKIIGKVYHNLGSNGVDDKDLAQALSKGDILR